MSATLTPLARRARLHQVPTPARAPDAQRFSGTEADDSSALPWARAGTGMAFQQLSDEQLREAGVDADAVRRSWLASQYAAGFHDGQEVGERQGTLRGWYWGAGCGAFATALVALVAGLALASWRSDDIGALPAAGSKAPTTSTPAAPRTTAPHWSAGT